MKHMWSEEELQEQTKIENLVDSKGRNRFIVGNGEPGNITGLTVASSKWALNGNNLIFEIIGTFSGNLSELDILSSFTIEDWILNKIVTPVSDVIDSLSCDMISIEDASTVTIKVHVTKVDNVIFFTNATDINISSISIFKIRCSTIIDNE